MAIEQSGSEHANGNAVPFPDWKKLRRKYSELGRGKKFTSESNEVLVYDEEINVG